MTEGQKNRQLGKNMKPRGINAQKQNEQSEAPTAVGQETGQNEAKTGSESEVESDGGQIPISSLSELLRESSISSPEEEMQAAFESYREQAMEAQQEEADATMPKFEHQSYVALEQLVNESVEAEQKKAAAAIFSDSVQSLDSQSVDPFDGMALAGTPRAYEGILRATDITMGINVLIELENGEHRATVRIPEGYAAGILEQCQADGVGLEDWLSLRFGEYIQQWFFAPGQR